MGLFKKKQNQTSFANDTGRQTLHKNLEFTAREQYKLFRANLDFTIPEGIKCPVIGITSAMMGEGKSTTAINLSYVLAEKGSRVLLIDGDLRKPSIASKMEMSASPGLTDVLMGKGEWQMGSFRSPLSDMWYIMPSGSIPPNPSELLGSKRMEATLKMLKEYFDYIVIDLPPVNVVSDALSIASFLTGMVIVIREEYTEKRELERCFRQLNLSNVNVLGCIMNETKSGSGSYGKYRRYGKYGKYGQYKYYRREHQPVPKEEKNG